MQNISTVVDERFSNDESTLGNSHSFARQPSTGHLIPLSSLTVTHGAAHGDMLTCAEDFVLGDMVKLDGIGLNLLVSLEELDACTHSLFFMHTRVGRQTMTAHVAKTLTMMSEFGEVVLAQILHDQRQSNGEAFILIDKALDPTVEYTLIA